MSNRSSMNDIFRTIWNKALRAMVHIAKAIIAGRLARVLERYQKLA